MQCADISQHDWHLGQILCNTIESNGETRVHCILLDFSQGSVGLDQQDFHRVDDFAECLRILCDPDSGFNADLVWENFGLRESWDHMFASVKVNDKVKWTTNTDPIDTLVPWGR